MKTMCDVKSHPLAWGGLQLVILLWHTLYTAIKMDPQYLLFICYPANLLVAVGIFSRHPALIGIGSQWTILALPFVLIDYVITGDYEISGVLFHLSGPIIGLMALRTYRLPGYTVIGALGLGLLCQVLARRLTAESLNINIAFAVWRGWEDLFPDYRIYMAVVYVGFLTFFITFQFISNAYIYHEKNHEKN
jgi:hypothetical protein